jgi:hypothetical protein
VTGGVAINVELDVVGTGVVGDGELVVVGPEVVADVVELGVVVCVVAPPQAAKTNTANMLITAATYLFKRFPSFTL